LLVERVPGAPAEAVHDAGELLLVAEAEGVEVVPDGTESMMNGGEWVGAGANEDCMAKRRRFGVCVTTLET